MQILIVDDDKDLVKSISLGLRFRGFKTLQAIDGSQALEHLTNNQHNIDMVITDYMMPGMDGIALLKTIKKSYQAIPVILISADGDKGLIRQAFREGCDSFVVKPFSLEKLVSEIQKTTPPYRHCAYDT